MVTIIIIEVDVIEVVVIEVVVIEVVVIEVIVIEVVVIEFVIIIIIYVVEVVEDSIIISIIGPALRGDNVSARVVGAMGDAKRDDSYSGVCLTFSSSSSSSSRSSRSSNTAAGPLMASPKKLSTAFTFTTHSSSMPCARREANGQ